MQFEQQSCTLDSNVTGVGQDIVYVGLELKYSKFY